MSIQCTGKKVHLHSTAYADMLPSVALSSETWLAFSLGCSSPKPALTDFDLWSHTAARSPSQPLLQQENSMVHGKLSWPGWLAYRGKFTHKVVTCQQKIRRRPGKVRRPELDNLTTEACCQPYVYEYRCLCTGAGDNTASDECHDECRQNVLRLGTSNAIWRPPVYVWLTSAWDNTVSSCWLNCLNTTIPQFFYKNNNG